jgi:hypothetical protein
MPTKAERQAASAEMPKCGCGNTLSKAAQNAGYTRCHACEVEYENRPLTPARLAELIDATVHGYGLSGLDATDAERDLIRALGWLIQRKIEGDA